MRKDQKKKSKKLQIEASARGEEMQRNEEKLVRHTISQKTNESKTSKSNKGEDREKPVFTCDYCQKEFSFSSHLKQHLPVHTGQKDYHCNLCDYSCAQKEGLQRHIRRHLNERPFKCQEPSCGASFTQSGDLKQHQVIHNKNNKRFSCSACPFKTHANKCLTAHMKNIHSESRPFKCPHENCEYSAKQKCSLSRHSKIHSEEKNRVCPHSNCGFKTKWPSVLKIHLETHSNEEKRFSCHFCEYSCHQHNDLVVHVRQHTGETPFACPICSYKSKQQSNLNRHMKTH